MIHRLSEDVLLNDRVSGDMAHQRHHRNHRIPQLLRVLIHDLTGSVTKWKLVQSQGVQVYLSNKYLGAYRARKCATLAVKFPLPFYASIYVIFLN
jgi:hypothetical protein